MSTTKFVLDPYDMITHHHCMNYWMQTYSGKRFDLEEIIPDSINIFDIAHSLSMQCRYNGHSKYFYSVAEHSVYVADHCPDELKFSGLMHDAAEAYIGDITMPVAAMLGGDFMLLKKRIEFAVAAHFGFEWPKPEAVHEADMRMLATEKESMMKSAHDWNLQYPPYDNFEIQFLSPTDAEILFLNRFQELRP